MIKEGTMMLAHTKTVNDTFGDVVWEVSNIDNDKVKLTMLGGSGPSARKGYAVQDSLLNIEKLIENKTIEVLDSARAKALAERYDSNGPSTPGGMEVNY